MDDAKLRTIEALRDQRHTVAAVARRIGISRQGLHAYLNRHGGWPCPKCGYESPDRIIVTPQNCLRCELTGLLTDPELPLPHGCEACGRETPSQRARFCADCAKKRRLHIIHRLQRDQDRQIAATASRRFARWQPDEDMLLLMPEVTLADAAILLHRTRPACVNRRRILKEAHS